MSLTFTADKTVLRHRLHLIRQSPTGEVLHGGFDLLEPSGQPHKDGQGQSAGGHARPGHGHKLVLHQRHLQNVARQGQHLHRQLTALRGEGGGGSVHLHIAA